MVTKNLRRPQLLLVMYLSRKRSLSSRLKQRKAKVFLTAFQSRSRFLDQNI